MDCKSKTITQFYCKYTHMHCTSTYEDNHAFLPLTASGTYFL